MGGWSIINNRNCEKYEHYFKTASLHCNVRIKNVLTMKILTLSYVSYPNMCDVLFLLNITLKYLELWKVPKVLLVHWECRKDMIVFRFPSPYWCAWQPCFQKISKLCFLFFFNLLQSGAMHVNQTHMACQGDVHTSVCSAAATKPGLVAAGRDSSWEVTAGHAKVCCLKSNTLPAAHISEWNSEC